MSHTTSRFTQNHNMTMVQPGAGDDPKSGLLSYNFACDSSDDDELADI